MKKVDKDVIAMQIKQILSEQLDLDVEKISYDTYLQDDLGIDSFTSIEIMFELEDKFGIEIPENDLANIVTVGDIINYISSRISS